jgi:hypothetical protein
MRRTTILMSSLVLLTACGSSSSTKSTSTPAGHTAASEAPATAAAKTQRDTVSEGVVTHRPLHGTGGGESNDDNPGKADGGNATATGQSDPCKLVSRAEARAILGKPLGAPQEAPLGPTCIYQPTRARTFVTLAVETVDFARIKPRIRHRTRIKVAGRTGYCGVYGQPTTFVPLNGGKVLNVTASCKIGTLFSVKALSRLNTGA